MVQWCKVVRISLKGSDYMLSDNDIREAIINKEMCITPFDVNNLDDRRLTPAGFNFSFSKFVVSLNQKTFIRIQEKDDELFFYLDQGDTAIALTNESVWVSKNIGGTFHSKVGYVSLGLGHISTTLDPYWQGQLLISINNPSKRKIKVVISRFRSGQWIFATFITLCLYRMHTEASRPSDNYSARLDTLYEIIKNDCRSKRQKQVVDIVKEMLAFMANQKDNDLRHNNNVKTEDIEHFITNHNAVLKEWEMKYPIIQELNNKVLFFKKLKDTLPLLILSVIVLALLVVAYFKLDDKEFLVATIGLFSAIVGGIITLIWSKKQG